MKLYPLCLLRKYLHVCDGTLTASLGENFWKQPSAVLWSPQHSGGPDFWGLLLPPAVGRSQSLLVLQACLTGVDRAPSPTPNAQEPQAGSVLASFAPKSKQEADSGPCSALALPQCPSDCSLGELIVGWSCWLYPLSVTICRSLILFFSDNEIAG